MSLNGVVRITHLTRRESEHKKIQNDNLTFQSSVPNKGLYDDGFGVFDGH